jgi:hypothetical protein
MIFMILCNRDIQPAPFIIAFLVGMLTLLGRGGPSMLVLKANCMRR